MYKKKYHLCNWQVWWLTLHTEHIVLVDQVGRIRGIYNGTLALEAAQLIKDIQLLKEEK